MQCHAGSRVALMPCHPGGAVVHHNRRECSLVVNRVCQRRHPSVEESAIADHRHVRSLEATAPHSGRHADAGSHTADGVGRSQWRHHAQRVTPDVAVHSEFHLPQNPEHVTVTAAGAQYWRAHRQGPLIQLVLEWRFVHQPGSVGRLTHHLRRKLVHQREDALALCRNTHDANVLFEEWIEFLDDDQPFYLRGKAGDHLLGQRPHHAQFEERGVGEDLARILVTWP